MASGFGGIKRVALIGGGVIGGGWAARFLSNGFDVRVYDKDPNAEKVIQKSLDHSDRAWSKLTMAPSRARGKITFCTDMPSALAEADYVQESVPEVLEIKTQVLAEIEKSVRPDVLIGSSTSGLLPSQMQANMVHPERLVVAHPFNPVYLLPLVEVVGGRKTSEESKMRVAALFEFLGMHPLVLHVEKDGFVSDRLQEALWREALHCVNDGLATVDQVDAAICYGPGLRWAFMGTFLAYRMAGGEPGMRHFLEHFGPALKLPWTNLVAPELTQQLKDLIVTQSDKQAGSQSITELERRRDDNIVAVLQALREQDASAGRTLRKFEKELQAEETSRVRAVEEDASKPLRLHTTSVKPGWIDYNGHMTESRYLQVFGEATDALLARIGVDDAYLGRGLSYYTAETHIIHKNEVVGGEPLAVATQLLSVDEKRIHLFHALENGRDGALLATAEQILLHVDTQKGRVCPADAAVLARLTPLADGHKALEKPKDVGRFVGAPRS